MSVVAYSPTHGVEARIDEVNKKLAKISSQMEQDSLIKHQNISKQGLLIFTLGYMVWWKKVDGAANYRIKLFIDNIEVDVIEIDRNKSYHTFTDLVGKGIFRVELEVEKRDGTIIDSVEVDLN